MGLSSFLRRLSHLLIIDISIDKLFLMEKLYLKYWKRQGHIGRAPSVRHGASLSRCREYIQNPESVKAKVNGRSAPGLDGFWVLDEWLTSGERPKCGKVPREYGLELWKKA